MRSEFTVIGSPKAGLGQAERKVEKEEFRLDPVPETTEGGYLISHTMGLYPEPFAAIRSGIKTVEVRLNDEKRRRIVLGDWIRFEELPRRQETVTVEVTALRVYSSFREMYAAIPAADFGIAGWSIDEMLVRTYQIYSPQDERQWGVLALTVRTAAR